MRYRTGMLSLALISIIGCTDHGDPVLPEGTPQKVSFGTDIQPIFNTSCARVGCHVQPAPTGGLDLGAGVSYAGLVGITSQNYAPAVRIVAGDPTLSVLYGKVSNTGQFNGLMPPIGAALTAQQIDLIRAWILEGAADN